MSQLLFEGLSSLFDHGLVAFLSDAKARGLQLPFALGLHFFQRGLRRRRCGLQSLPVHIERRQIELF
jgi:hypothetical protein